MFTTRVLGRVARHLVLVATMLLSVLVLSAPADAQTGATCAEGTFDGVQCVIEGAPPAPGSSRCPVSATVVEDGPDCYTLVAANEVCEIGSILVDDECRKPVADLPGPLTCAVDFGLVNGECIRVEPAVASCVNGTLVGSACVIEGAPPVPGPSRCPVSATVVEDGPDCYTLVLAECPAGTTLDPNGVDCRQPVARVLGPFTCATGFSLVNGDCIRFEPAVASCVNGTLEGTLCVIEGAPPLPGPSRCPVSATVLEDGPECYTLISGPCPPGTTLDPNGIDCRRPVALVPGALTCAPDFGLVNGECLRFEQAALECPTGDLDGTQCVVEGPRPVASLRCPVSATVIEDGPDCYTLVLAECPPGTTLDPNGFDCRQPVERVPGPLICASGFVLDDGQCVRFEPSVLGCATGDLDGTQCRIVGPPPVAGPSICPPGSLGEPGGCYLVVDPTFECPVGTTLDPNGFDCRLPVDRVPGPLTCEEGFSLIDGSCLRFATPAFLCDGQTVTINMMTGAAGSGTSGNDVILGTNGADTIDGRGGDDLICGQNGADTITGGNGSDVIFGQGGDDEIRGNGGDDVIRGNGGNDFLSGGSGNDDLRGGAGNDAIRGGGGDDIVRGNAGDDDLRGGADNDVIRGGSGDDVLRGNAGDDDLRGNADTDSCIGGNGSDVANASCEATTSVP